MKILSYNILEGARARHDELVAFVSGHEPDVVCLQEANGWGDDDAARARAFAAAVGLPHVCFGTSNTPFDLVTFSRRPFISTAVDAEGFWHCAVRAAVPCGGGTLDVWNLHLDPRDEDRRLSEAQRLASLARPAEPTLVVGDLNSLSPLDEYPSGLRQRLQARGITKFGRTRLRHEAMTALAGAGLVDMAHARGTSEWTVPTPSNMDVFHAGRLRLDYALANAELAPSVTSVRVERNDLTDRISDHYPLVVMLG